MITVQCSYTGNYGTLKCNLTHLARITWQLNINNSHLQDKNNSYTTTTSFVSPVYFY